MSRQAKKSYHHLKVLASSNPSQVKAIIKTADEPLIHTLCECIYNLLNCNLKISSRKKKRLIPHRNHLIKLATKEVPLKKKRQILVQKGGNFLSLVLPPAIALLEHFIKK